MIAMAARPERASIDMLDVCDAHPSARPSRFFRGSAIISRASSASDSKKVLPANLLAGHRQNRILEGARAGAIVRTGGFVFASRCFPCVTRPATWRRAAGPPIAPPPPPHRPSPSHQAHRTRERAARICFAASIRGASLVSIHHCSRAALLGRKCPSGGRPVRPSTRQHGQRQHRVSSQRATRSCLCDGSVLQSTTTCDARR